MTVKIRRSDERGHLDHGWLDTYHSFSFGDYHDPNFMGFRSLRVINEDRVAGGEGFPTHPHSNMEIITYIIEGALEHKDSMGTGSVIKTGDVQKMSAGEGITHSEFNASQTEAVHLIQIWIVPDKKGIKPFYQQINFSKKEGLTLVGSNKEQKETVLIHQDVQLYLGRLSKGKVASLDLKSGRAAWIQMIKGKLKVNTTSLHTGDGASIEHENHLQLEAEADVEFLLFDLG